MSHWHIINSADSAEGFTNIYWGYLHSRWIRALKNPENFFLLSCELWQVNPYVGQSFKLQVLGVIFGDILEKRPGVYCKPSAAGVSHGVISIRCWQRIDNLSGFVWLWDDVSLQLTAPTVELVSTFKSAVFLKWRLLLWSEEGRGLRPCQGG